MKFEEIRKAIRSGESMARLPLRVAFYARVSTDKNEQQNSLINQTSYYEKMICGNKNWIFCGGYIDEGISGTGVEKRAGFLQMIEDAKRGKFDLILTKEISRFSRNTLDSLTYTRSLLENGVGVYFENDGINTLLPDSELRLTILSSIAQDEVRKLSERVKFGFRRAQENGIVLGNDNLFGYKKEKGALTVVRAEAETVREIFYLYVAERCGIRRIARILHEKGFHTRAGKDFSYASIYGMIRNPKYKGYYSGKKYSTSDYRTKKRIRLPDEEWITFPDPAIPAIVEESVWDEANRLLASRGRNVKEKKICFQNHYSYSGKIICKKHGAAYHRILVGKEKREAWFCGEYRRKGKEKGCGGPFFYTEDLDRILEKVWSRIELDQAGISAILKAAFDRAAVSFDGEDRRSEIEKSKRELKTKKEKLFELYEGRFLSGEEFFERNEAINRALEGLSEREKKLISERMSAEERARMLDRLLQKIRTVPREKEFLDLCRSEYLSKIVVGGSREAPELEIVLSGEGARASEGDQCFLFCEMGISQAQVSRLEKSALDRIRKKMV